ncbi:hypothetical protein Pmar_PMAR012420, partial [Perkinsus marinus ATCC 50983]
MSAINRLRLERSTDEEHLARRMVKDFNLAQHFCHTLPQARKDSKHDRNVQKLQKHHCRTSLELIKIDKNHVFLTVILEKNSQFIDTPETIK